jgi:hypothetical protein
MLVDARLIEVSFGMLENAKLPMLVRGMEEKSNDVSSIKPTNARCKKVRERDAWINFGRALFSESVVIYRARYTPWTAIEGIKISMRPYVAECRDGVAR